MDPKRLARVVKVGAAESSDDSWRLARGVEVDRQDARMSERAPDHGRMEKPFRLQVIDESSLSTEEPGVLNAKDALADHAARAIAHRAVLLGSSPVTLGPCIMYTYRMIPPESSPIGTAVP
jgi:hypothetical protein